MLKSDSVKGNIDYDDWLQRCNNVMLCEVGTTTSEFSNVNWGDFYDQGKTPREAVERVLHEYHRCDLNDDQDDEIE